MSSDDFATIVASSEKQLNSLFSEKKIKIYRGQATLLIRAKRQTSFQLKKLKKTWRALTGLVDNLYFLMTREKTE